MARQNDAAELRVVARAEISAGDWDAVVNDSPDGWVFSLSGWQDLILAVEKWGLEDFSFGLRESGRLLAVVPLQFNRYNRRISSSGWGGSGPVLHASLAGKNRQRVMRAALARCAAVGRDCGATHFDFSASPVTGSAIASAWGVNPFVAHGLDDLAGLSQVIDLAPSEDVLWAGLSADARRQVRIARERGYVAERADWDECLEHYYALHCETYRRTGVEPHPIDYFAGMASHTARSGHSVLWRVRSSDGATLAYHNAAWFGAGGNYHTGCSDAVASESGASYLLFWQAMLGAKAAGLRWYDCGAVFPNVADGKQRGLTTFKTKFGGEAHRLFRVEMRLQEDAVAAASCPAEEVSAPFASRLRRVLVKGVRRLTISRSGQAGASES